MNEKWLKNDNEYLKMEGNLKRNFCRVIPSVENLKKKIIKKTFKI